ncbi:MAG: DUF2399 domain-containing protein [Pseudomonadota bacterium]
MTRLHSSRIVWAAFYLAALRGVPVSGRALGPEGVDADWDDGLGPAMREHDRAVDEEAVAAMLVRDFERAGQ